VKPIKTYINNETQYEQFRPAIRWCFGDHNSREKDFSSFKILCAKSGSAESSAHNCNNQEVPWFPRSWRSQKRHTTGGDSCSWPAFERPPARRKLCKD